ncbi:hybrid sensor histidine kinase/response regulator transcription factor [Pelagicoccus mobilis]|uniref:histidine kinase n=1 Tax=Pelagicoccus mobilis TaxID=415221 RepID=A0A934RUH1_9BACT|nr:response regulator [Pelagicoccus mobilis]MBK1875354.1 response regulator [Pelagicoccus mobilis]
MAPLSVKLCIAAEKFTPDTHIDLNEPWRWTVLEELENHEAYCAAYDTNGTVWFGQAAGLTSFDGVNYRSYPFDFDSGGALYAKNVFCASDGSVYLMTTKRIAVLKPNREWAWLMDIDTGQTKSPMIAESQDGSIWLVVNNQLHHYGPQGISVVRNLPLIHESIVVDRRDRIWLREMEDSNLLIHPAKLDETLSLASPGKVISINPWKMDTTSALYEDRDGSIWVLTIWAKHFAQRFDLDFNRTIHPAPPPLDRRSNLSFVSIDEETKLLLRPPELLLYQDGQWQNLDTGSYSVPSNNPYLIQLSDGKLLLGGNVEQSYLIDSTNNRWETFHGLNIQCEDANGNEWYLSQDNKVILHESDKQQWTRFDTGDGLIDAPNRITISDDGTVWVSGRHQGIAAVSRLESGSWTTDSFPSIGYTFSHLGVLKTQDGNIIFGNGSERPMPDGSVGGIVVYRKTEGEYLASHLAPPLYPERVATLVEQPGHGLWLGSFNLARIQPSTGLGAEPVAELSATWIDHLSIDRHNRVWVAKWGDGLYCYDGNDWKLYRSADGIASNQTVFALPSKRDDTLWLATRNNLSRFDGTSWTRDAFADGFEFHREGGTLFESNNGELWINQAPRLWAMNRERPVPDQGLPFRTIRYRQDQLPPHTLLDPSETQLNEPADALFSWHGLDQWNDTPSHKLEYSYRISDQEWSPFQQDTQVSILDLPSGSYTFEVKARDRDLNVDPTPASLSFQIIAPLWKQAWFIISAFLSCAAIITLIAIVIRMRMRHLIALEEFKLDFFTNLSHELRTPLSVILGPLESLAAKARSKDQKATFDMVLRNTHKMLDLVNKLLEFRKVELGKLKYRPVQGEVIGFIKDAIFSLSPLWENKKQTLTIHSELAAYRCGFDPDKLLSIIDNIVSNAIKYTPDKGTIDVSIKIDTDSNGKAALDFKVSDNGIGIAKDKLPKVTDPFYRADSELSEQESSGIGLALVAGLVEVWGGETTIESKTEGPERGTSISIHLPLNLFKGSLPDPAEEKAASERQEIQQAEALPPRVSKPKILIVEDNPDVLKFLEHEIGEHFETLSASNGIEGLQQIKSSTPDLIITDVMMPEMDGIEFCRAIRANKDICHLPIIILTARTADEHYLEGIEIGADEYFSKPIRADLLIARINNLFHSRQQLRERFASQVLVEPQEVAIVSSDKQLIERAIKILESNLQTESYDVEAFAKDLAMSRITLYRKLKAITGLSAVDFMRSIRLKRAAQLLRATDLTVGEILIQVGYYDASSFSRAFKKEFNRTPTQYREEEGTEIRPAS